MTLSQEPRIQPSAYLRTYVTVNLISVEQLSFSEFVSTLSSPTCIATIGMNPFEGVGVLELNPSLAFPLIECLLGGGKVKPLVVTREMTAIEERILGGLLPLILQNLSLSWQSVATVNFSVESHESEPALDPSHGAERSHCRHCHRGAAWRELQA